MGEAKRKRRAHETVLRNCPVCIYCGGVKPATTVEHMPPAVMFWRKHRPKGLEFAACAECNTGSSHADLVAAMVSRMLPDPPSGVGQAEFGDLCQAVGNNIPGLPEEMHLTEEEQQAYGNGLPHHLRTGLLRAGGPILTRYMQAFGLKAALALHFETTKRVVPPMGVVGARWFSNVERVTGNFPDTIFDHLLPARTLSQGRFEVSDQFQYSWRLRDDGAAGLYFAAFRFAFAVVAFAARDRELLSDNGGVVKFSPLEVGQMLRTL
jgi:hypothetical protein